MTVRDVETQTDSDPRPDPVTAGTQTTDWEPISGPAPHSAPAPKSGEGSAMQEVVRRLSQRSPWSRHGSMASVSQRHGSVASVPDRARSPSGSVSPPVSPDGKVPHQPSSVSPLSCPSPLQAPPSQPQADPPCDPPPAPGPEAPPPPPPAAPALEASPQLPLAKGSRGPKSHSGGRSPVGRAQEMAALKQKLGLLKKEKGPAPAAGKAEVEAVVLGPAEEAALIQEQWAFSGIPIIKVPPPPPPTLVYCQLKPSPQRPVASEMVCQA